MNCIYELELPDYRMIVSNLAELFSIVYELPWGSQQSGVFWLENTAIFVEPKFYRDKCGFNFDKCFGEHMNGWAYNKNIRFSITDPGEPSKQKNYGLHIDCTSKGYILPAVLNFPVLNCGLDCETKWYTVTKGRVEFNEKYCSYSMPDGNQFSNCDSFCISEKPVLFKSSIHHEMINESGKMRVLAGFLFDFWLDWMQLVEKFEQKNQLLPRA